MKLLLWLSFAVLAGCASFQTGADVTPNYGADAESNITKGNEALAGKNFLEAEKYFEYVRGKYPYLDAAKEAELRLADTDFERERYIEARDRYNNFVKLHPTHAKVDYAAYRAAFTNYKEIPSDFFLLPSAIEKDQAPVRSALSSMNNFVLLYPTSKYVDDAKKIIQDSRRRLAQHEMYVASFYSRRERWSAVVGRLNHVVSDYPGAGFDEDAYFGLYEAYKKLSDEARAKEALRSIVAKLPGTRAAEKAKKLLGEQG